MYRPLMDHLLSISLMKRGGGGGATIWYCAFIVVYWGTSVGIWGWKYINTYMTEGSGNIGTHIAQIHKTVTVTQTDNAVRTTREHLQTDRQTDRQTSVYTMAYQTFFSIGDEKKIFLSQNGCIYEVPVHCIPKQPWQPII